MKFYADIYLMNNILFDYMGICIVGMITDEMPMRIRAICSSVFGALYALLSLFLPAGRFSDMIIAAVMSVIAFGYKSLKGFISRTVLFYIVMILNGGIAGYIIGSGVFMFEDYGYITIIVLLLMLCGASDYLLGYYLKRRNKYDTYDVRIIVRKNNDLLSFDVRAVYDSCNLLKDPFTENKVILLTQESFYECFGKEESMIKLNDDVPELIKSDIRFRLIPINCVGNKNILIQAFTPECVVIKDSRGRKTYIHRITVGIYGEKDGFAGYNALLPCGIFK